MKKFEFLHKVFFTAAISYLCISFLFIGMIALFDDSAAEFQRFVFFRYIFGKLLCIFLFSLVQGLINRVMETGKNHALMRLLHFTLSLISFVVFMILGFYSLFAADTLTAKGALFNLCLFVVGYFVVLGVVGLFRSLFEPKKKEEFKSVLN